MENKLRFEWSIPNALSILRLILVPVFAALYLNSSPKNNLVYWAFGALLLSALTDCVDGFIARKLNQQTEFGKFIDPLSDKITQVAVAICLSIKHKELIPLAVLCLGKELLQLLGFLLLYKKIGSDGLECSQWFGKIATFMFYFSMLLIIVWDGMPYSVLVTLVSLVGLTMLFALLNYIRAYFRIKKTID